MIKPRIAFKRWRNVKIIYGLLALQFAFVLLTLILFGLASEYDYRAALWEDGYLNGFNSNPSQPIFNLDNGGTMTTPLVWSDFVTKFNVFISVLSMFLLLIKGVMATMGIFYPVISASCHCVEMILWAYSIHAQTAPDTIDPEHINNGPPWFITKSCSVTKLQQDVGSCEQAKASFYAAVFTLALFCIQILLALHSIVFAPEPKPEDEEKLPIESKGKEPERQWEMVPIPATPGTPFGRLPMSPMTPRTKAFQALEGEAKGLPFRQRYPEPPPLSFPPPPKAKKGKR